MKRSLILPVRPFPEGLRSGGDLQWTKRATSAGFSSFTGADAVVYEKALKAGALLKKQWRVARGQPQIWKSRETVRTLSQAIFEGLTPLRQRSLKRKLVWIRR